MTDKFYEWASGTRARLDRALADMPSVHGLRTFRHGDATYVVVEGAAHHFSTFHGQKQSTNDDEICFAIKPRFEISWTSDRERYADNTALDVKTDDGIGENFSDVVRVFNRYARGLLIRFRSHFRSLLLLRA